MAKQAVIRYNPAGDKCEIEIRDQSLPEDQFGEVFPGEVPDDGIDILESADGETYIAVHDDDVGLPPGVYPLGETLPTAIEEVEDEYFEASAEPEAGSAEA